MEYILGFKQMTLTMPQRELRQFSARSLIIAALLMQVLLALPLLTHQSTSPQFFGRYSLGYAAALAVMLLIVLGWMIAFLRHPQIDAWLESLSSGWIWAALSFSLAAACVIWFVPVEIQLKQGFSLNGLLFAVWMALKLPEGEFSEKRWRIGVILFLAALFIPILITALTTLPYSPDEAHWADYATSPYAAEGLYARTWLDTPTLIKPGIGWSVAAYGWLLENVAFDLRIGRLWNLALYLIAFGLMGWTARRLYDGRVAFGAVSLAFLSLAFFPVADYRPEQQLPAAMMLCFLTAVQARLNENRRASALWHVVCGFAATFSLELHAAAVMYAVGFSLYYALEFGWGVLRRRADLLPVIAFGFGAGVGTLLYFALNIAPVGGLDVFLTTLVNERLSPDRSTLLLRLSWPSLLEFVLILAGFAYLMWRRLPADRLFLGLFAAVGFSLLLLDSWGYRMAYQAACTIPLAALLVDFGGRRSAVVFSALLIILAGQLVGTRIDLAAVRDVFENGRLPESLIQRMGDSLAGEIQPEDVLVASHELIWIYPEHGQFYSLAAEISAMRRWKLDDPLRVWERIAPTVIVDIGGPIVIPAGLQAYMQQENFAACDRPALMQPITIYRRGC